MRKLLATAVLAGAAALAGARQDEPPAARYGVPPAPDSYPQTSAKAALESVVLAAENGRADYLAAHLIDPRVIDARVADRARPLVEAVDRDLRAAREAQRVGAVGVPRDQRLPDDPRAFADAVQAEAQARAFRLVVRDVRDTLAENPDHLKDLRRVARAGAVAEAGDTASAAVRGGEADRQVFLRRAEGRWVVEDRKRADLPADKK